MHDKLFRKTLSSLFCFLGALWAFPVFMVFINSFKNYDELFNRFLAFPQRIDFSMYKETWEIFNFPRLISNTLFSTICVVALICLFAPMAAYKLSRTQTKQSKLIFFVLILPALVPFQSYMTMLIRLMAQTNLVATRMGYIIVMVGTAIPGAVLMIHGFVKGIPVELEECAYLDGASNFRTYFAVVLPLLSPIIVTVLVLNTLGTWNDFFVNMLIMGGREETLNISNALYAKFSMQSSDWKHALPGLVMAMLPNLLFFIFMQRYIVEGITAGAVKA